MALTLAKKQRSKLTGRRSATTEVTFDNSYPTGGESLTPQDLGLETIDFLAAHPAGGYVFEYDYANKKLKAYYGNYDAADGPLIEVPNGTDLSAVVTRVFAIGT